MIRRTLAAVAVVTAAATAPAPATIVERGRIVDGEYGFGYDHCGFPVDVKGVASGNFRLREGKNADDSVFFSLDRLSFREVHTNTETGAWFSISGHFANNEVTAHRLEGSVFEVRINKAGQVAVIEDSDGNLVVRDRGLFRQTILFDTGGDAQPGGQLVEVLEVRFAGSHTAFDICPIAQELIG